MVKILGNTKQSLASGTSYTVQKNIWQSAQNQKGKAFTPGVSNCAKHTHGKSIAD